MYKMSQFSLIQEYLNYSKNEFGRGPIETVVTENFRNYCLLSSTCLLGSHGLFSSLDCLSRCEFLQDSFMLSRYFEKILDELGIIVGIC